MFACMSSQCSFNIDASQDILQLHGLLKQHAILSEPPFAIASVMSPFMRQRGRSIRVVIHHRSRDVQVVESSVSNHVLQTTVRAFQAHRLSTHAPTMFEDRPVFQPTVSVQSPAIPTQCECPICFDTICANQGLALPCMHAFHAQCIRQWLVDNRTCPVCRHAV